MTLDDLIKMPVKDDVKGLSYYYNELSNFYPEVMMPIHRCYALEEYNKLLPKIKYRVQ
jgi:hypothetical protein